MRTLPRAGSRAHFAESQLTPIPGSPYTTEQSAPPSPTSTRSLKSLTNKDNKQDDKAGLLESSLRTRSKSTFVQLKSPQPQSLNAAIEKLTSSPSESGGDSSMKSLNHSSSRTTVSSNITGDLQSTSFSTDKSPHPSPKNGPPVPTFGGKPISAPIMNHGMCPGFTELR